MIPIRTLQRLLIFLFLCIIISNVNLSAQTKLELLIEKLDGTVEKDSDFIQKKSSLIKELKLGLVKPSAQADRYKLLIQLATEYQVFIADSAQHYAHLAIDLANHLEDSYKLNESTILLAAIEAKTGMFPIAIELLDKVDVRAMNHIQQINYYKTLSEVYIYWMEYQQGHESERLISKRNAIRDSLIAILPGESMEYAVNKATKLIEEQKFSEAETLLLDNFKSGLEGTREYSIYTSILAYLYEMKGERQKQMEYLALSAISDIEGSIMENLSLRSLALKLYEEGDLQRANLYIKKSLRDANFFNARLRNLQISRILPIIDEAYEIEKQKQEERRRVLLIAVTVLSLVLLVSAFLLFRQKQKVSRARKSLGELNGKLVHLNQELSDANASEREMNRSLLESNRIKEQYIHSFLELCTSYIERLENLKRIVSGKIRSGQSPEVLRLVESSQLVNEELKELYRNFDRAFLKVYPEFVPQLNLLLREEEHYTYEGDEVLNHELRPYALIRLGITENAQIATFLHYSLRTVYNYRSKVKNKAKSPTTFEQDILHLGIEMGGEYDLNMN